MTPKAKLYCKRLKQNVSRITMTGPSLERVPRVPRHPLRFCNGCQAPVLIRAKTYQIEKIVPQVIDFK